jgi:hypothetical protein
MVSSKQGEGRRDLGFGQSKGLSRKQVH